MRGVGVRDELGRHRGVADLSAELVRLHVVQRADRGDGDDGQVHQGQQKEPADDLARTRTPEVDGGPRPGRLPVPAAAALTPDPERNEEQAGDEQRRDQHVAQDPGVGAHDEPQRVGDVVRDEGDGGERGQPGAGERDRIAGECGTIRRHFFFNVSM